MSGPDGAGAGRGGRLRFRSAALAAIAAALLAGCGSQEGFPPPAEPAVSPPPASAPAGEVVELGGEAEGIVADPRTGVVAVATRDPDRVLLVSDPLSRDPRVRALRVPQSARHMQLARPGGPVLTTAEYSDDLLEIALPGGSISTTKVGDFPHDATAAADGRIFVADEGADTLSVVDGGRVTATLPAPEQPGGIAASGDLVAVIAVAERVLATYDARTLEPAGEVQAGAGPTHIVAGPEGRLYVADTQGDAILVFETAPELRFIDRANLPGAPYGIALDARAGMLWVTQTDRNRVVGFELTGRAPERVVSFPTVRQPNTIAVDEATGVVYVAGRSGGELQAIDPAREAGQP